MGDPPEWSGDVVIVGAGLSGIGMAARLRRSAPWARFVILEGRARPGGTWDLFRYPGVRSDSDMHTLGYGFRAWTSPQSIASGADILAYIEATAREERLGPHLRTGRRVESASWDSAASRWTVRAAHDGASERFTCRFLVLCAGYYDADRGHAPVFAQQERFGGRIVHPQFWPGDLDVRGCRVAVIGSGATAVTLVPALAARGAQVTMVQRSPGYIASRPSRDRLQGWLERHLSPGRAARLTRAARIAEQIALFQLARRRPALVRRKVREAIVARLGPDYPVDVHFAPRYDPWDQRFCLVPDNDLFDAIRDGHVTVETGRIERFDATGIVMESGAHVEADIIVTATGLSLRPMGGIALDVDGAAVDAARAMVYKGAMLSDVPNHVFVVGYTNASWTLKADLVSHFTARLLNFMRRRGYATAVAVRDPSVGERALLELDAGYVERARHLLPSQGERAPWRLFQNVLRDTPMFRLRPLKDGVLRFSRNGRESWR
ncbi:cation diffusion facilitator CzcD-associated flavoprotein CzcO [Endobacter medicaginis]|uniref:Cation diffusion facilitator CzcD-associated flavoprotein CzcO n=3 Tax=Endobacter medicaginis TaxID=1181271 RepID=A0A839V3B7_9PROT|nr:NAD(P)/FAD-dependent oxidoreductase [Endobacter medicaginis]MBB3173981.1 cation diffusion facilitator CzcD-associated flavoprotein CzcO [Endobacter medicaginis]MCX5475161.1 NAD(P)/FAD-dependent oxidoreductase [Endobacter medicaginis]